jgi:hypothetical protein
MVATPAAVLARGGPPGVPQAVEADIEQVKNHAEERIG